MPPRRTSSDPHLLLPHQCKCRHVARPGASLRIIRPLRTAKGHRFYAHAHVGLIRAVPGFFERGVPINRRQLLRSLMKIEKIAARAAAKERILEVSVRRRHFMEGSRLDELPMVLRMVWATPTQW